MGLNVSRDRKLVVTCGNLGSVKLWDAVTGFQLRSFIAPQSDDVWFGVVSVSDDATRVAAGSLKGEQYAVVWNASTGELVSKLEDSGGLRSMALSPDGKRLVGGAMDGVRVWDVDTHHVLFKLPAKLAVVAYAKNGKMIATADESGALSIWDAESGASLQTVKAHDGRVFGLRIARDDDEIVTAGKTEIKVWRFDQLTTPVAALPYPNGAELQKGAGSLPYALDLSKDHATVLSEAAIIDVKTRVSRPFQNGYGAAFLDSDREIVFGSTGIGGAPAAISIEDDAIREFAASAKPGIGRVLAGRTPSTALLRSIRGLDLWDFTTLSPRGHVDLDTYNSIASSSDRRTVVVADKEMVRLLDFETGKLTRTISIAQGIVPDAIAIDDRAQVAVVGDADGTVQLWDLQKNPVVKRTLTTKLCAQPKTYPPPILVGISPDAGRIVAACRTKFVSWSGPKYTLDVESTTNTVTKLLMSPNGKTVVTGGFTGHPEVRDASTFKLVRTLNGGSGAKITALAMSNDGSRIVGGRADGSVDLWNLSVEDALAETIATHESPIEDVSVLADDSFFSIGFNSLGKLTRLFPAKASKVSISVIRSGDDWLVFSDDGYFDASRGGTHLVAAVQGVRSFSIDQLSIRNNRPDLLLQKIGSTDEARIAHYRARHAVRLKQLNLREEDLASRFEDAPTVRIVETRREGRSLDVTFEMTATRAPLARFDVYADNVPLASAGYPATGMRMRTTQRVDLGNGDNKIEVGARDSRGVESLRDIRVVRHSGASTKQDVFYLGLGVSHYTNPSLDLGFAAKDAVDIGEAFRKLEKVSFYRVHVKTLTDSEVTRESIAVAKAFFAEAQTDDIAVVFVAGHGAHTRDAEAQYFYATSNVDLKNFRATAAPFAMLEGLLEDIRPRYRLMLLDTCESGERDEETNTQNLGSAATSRGLSPRGSTRALVLIDSSGAQTPPAPSAGAPAQARTFLLDRNRHIYADLSRHSGALVFSSSRGSEYSFEHTDWQNGAFTADLKNALTGATADTDNNGYVSFDEISAYVTSAVAKRTDERQHPVVDHDNRDVQIVWSVPATNQ